MTELLDQTALDASELTVRIDQNRIVASGILTDQNADLLGLAVQSVSRNWRGEHRLSIDLSQVDRSDRAAMAALLDVLMATGFQLQELD